jgi:hypothetical protein
MPRKVDTPKPGPTRSQKEREAHRLELPKLMRRGWTQTMIAEKFGVSSQQIACDWKIVVKDLNREATAEVREHVALKLQEYAEVKREMWEAWEKSKQNQEERLEEDVSSERGGHTKTALKEKGSCGDAKYMNIILECLKAERELQGLNPAKEIKGNITTTSINWEVIAQGIPVDGPVPDEIEAEIRKQLGYTDPAYAVITDETTVPNVTEHGDTIDGDTIYVNPHKSQDTEEE